MPARDKTGPLGEGPKTGRGLGPCVRGNSAKSLSGKGIGFRRGFRGRNLGADKEKQFLKEELKLLEEDIKEIKQRLKEIENN